MGKEMIKKKNNEKVFESRCEKLKTLFLHPKNFFEKVSEEKEYMPILLCFVIITGIFYLINWAIGVIRMLTTLNISTVIIGAVFSLFILGMSIGFAFATPFISAGITHLGVMIFGGRKGYFNTFKPETYSLIIGVIWGFIIYLISLILEIIKPISVESVTGTGISSILSVIPLWYITIYLVIIIASAVHVLYAQTIGLAKFQEISKTRAFLSIIIIRILLVIIIAIPMLLLYGFATRMAGV